MCDLPEKSLPAVTFSRRHLLKAAAFTAITPFSLSSAFAAETSPAPNAIPPGLALSRLLVGNARYAANNPNDRDFTVGRAERAQSQFPIAAVLSCADSRVAPELLFDQNPGDLFVMRVAGNVMSPDLLASLEYGVKFLGTPLVMVLGHSNCGAVSAAINVLKDNAKLPGHLPDLIASIKPAVAVAKKTHPDDLLESSIAENVRLQVAQLKKSSPIVDRYYADRKIDIVGAVYDLKTGRIALV
ncbi:carbonic anhydrase [Sneathiella sp.]|uniref:carbonic anhydrase n=1 Tax=Sneathiella sp. TaxID=1964365 RepID=UPI00262B6AE9|nr:carbonic anhydrase [Sneathiella sp.]MDF2368027.1 carbonic anhydrase [Sneathiella sp.]